MANNDLQKNCGDIYINEEVISLIKCAGKPKPSSAPKPTSKPSSGTKRTGGIVKKK